MSKKPKPVAKKPKKIYGRGKGKYEYEADGVTPKTDGVTPKTQKTPKTDGVTPKTQKTPIKEYEYEADGVTSIPMIHLVESNPLINQDNDNKLSVNPKSENVKWYKKHIDILIKSIRDGKPPDYQLTIEDCKNIKDSLPDEHARIKVDGKDDILYDHLFIKYFIKKEKKYNYDEKYKEDLDIYLYLNVYNSLIKKLKPLPRLTLLEKLKPLPTQTSKLLPRQSTRLETQKLLETQQRSSSDSFGTIGTVGSEYSVKDLLKNNININKTDFSIGNLIYKLCIDIENFLGAYNLKEGAYNKIVMIGMDVRDNLKILNYASSIYELCEVKDFIINKNKMVDYFIKLFRSNPVNSDKSTDYIFLEIIILLMDVKPVKPIRSEDILDYFNKTITELEQFKSYKIKSYKEIFIILVKLYKNISLYIHYNTYQNKKEKRIFTFVNIDYADIRDSDIIPSETKLDEDIKNKCGTDWKDFLSTEGLKRFYRTTEGLKRYYSEKKQHMSYINYRDSDTITCFDTISIYNHIIDCLNKGKNPDNPFNREILEGDDIVKICDNVSEITKNKRVLLEAKLIKLEFQNKFRFIQSSIKKLNSSINKFEKIDFLFNLL